MTNNIFVKNPINGNIYYLYDSNKITIVNSDFAKQLQSAKELKPENFREFKHVKKSTNNMTDILDVKGMRPTDKKIKKNIHYKKFSDNNLYSICEIKGNYWLCNHITKNRFQINHNFLNSMHGIQDINIGQATAHTELENFVIVEDIHMVDVFFTVFIMVDTDNKDTLEKCIMSLTTQTYSNFEIYCCIDKKSQNYDELMSSAHKIRASNKRLTIISNNFDITQNYVLLTKFANPNSIIVLINRTSTENHTNMLSELNFKYYAKNCLMTDDLGHQDTKSYYRELFLALPRNIIEINNKLCPVYKSNDVASDLVFMKPMAKLYKDTPTAYDKLQDTPERNILINKLERYKNIYSINLAQFRNTHAEKENELQNRFMCEYLKPGKLKIALLGSRDFSNYFIDALKCNSFFKSLIQKNLTTCSDINENIINCEFDSLRPFLKDNFRSVKDYETICNVAESWMRSSVYLSICYNILKHITFTQKMDYNVMEKQVYYNFPNDTKIKYDINFVVPVKNRIENLNCLVKNVTYVAGKSKYKILITVVELDSVKNHEKICKEYNVNYINIDTCRLDCKFNKSIAPNFMHRFYKKMGYKYDWMCYHDVDCIIKSTFFDNAFKNIEIEQKLSNKKFRFLQTYAFGTVHLTNQEIAKKIRENHKIVDTMPNDYVGITFPHAYINESLYFSKSKGGSVMITPELFEEIGGFDPELFADYSPEDTFFWSKASLKVTLSNEYIVYADDPPNKLYHLWHESGNTNEEQLTYMYSIQRLYETLPQGLKLRYIDLKNKLLVE